MKNYKDNDYAVNRYAKGIVYRFRQGRALEITLGDYLAENPNASDLDFLVMKSLSDAIYYNQDRDEYNQTRLNLSMHGMEKSQELRGQSPEDMYIEAQDHLRALVAYKLLLDSGALTDTQRRRFLMEMLEGLSSREIADRECVCQRAVIKSLHAAKVKLKKYFDSLGTHPPL